jgi:hypothetical protein
MRNFFFFFITLYFSPTMDFSGFLRRVAVKPYDIWKERTAFIFRVTVMVDMDTEVIKKKQTCLLLGAMKESSWKI